MKISTDEVIRVAELAHLGLSPEEVETYRRQLDAILTYVDKLKELDITNVEPMAQVLHASANTTSQDTNPELREDILQPCDVAGPVLTGAPGAQKPFFRVPKVIDR